MGATELLPLSLAQEVHSMPSITKSDIATFLSIKDFEFTNLALDLYQRHLCHHGIYAKWVKLLYKSDKTVDCIEDIPFLPISLFKHHVVSLFDDHEKIFTSSSTTGQGISKHYFHVLQDYVLTFCKGFDIIYKKESFDTLVALLPGYLDRQGSSLVYMVDELMKKHVGDGAFFKNNYEEAAKYIEKQTIKNRKVLLFGVTFGLLNLLELNNSINWNFVTVIETGGMKGHGKELSRSELYEKLETKWTNVRLDSEYGMTELTSQAYAVKNTGRFYPPTWMKILIKDKSDPQKILGYHKTGKICIIDLANYHSCPFIESDDLGRLYPDGSFEVLGRIDHSDIRGCNLLL